MSEIFLWLFLEICTALLIWGLRRPDRIYQFPFFMGAIFTSFLAPQAVALVKNPGVASSEAVDRALLFSCLCAAMCWIGYQWNPNPKLLHRLAIPLNERKLFVAGVVLTIFSYFFGYLMVKEVAKLDPTTNVNWTGAITIYGFLFSVIYITFPIFLLLSLKRASFANILWTAIACYPILGAAFGAGRRQGGATLFVIIGLCLFYARRYVPPRWFVLTIVFGSMFLIPLVGGLRGEFWANFFQLNFKAINWQAGLTDVLTGKILELRNAAILMEGVEKTGKYGYGTGFWDAIIFQFVPGQIIGKTLKESLQFKVITPDLFSQLGYKVPTGSTWTGVGDSFAEFGYLGCLIFAILAYGFKQLWVSSAYQNIYISQVLYAGLLIPATIGVTHGIRTFIQNALFQILFLGLVVLYSRYKQKVNYL